MNNIFSDKEDISVFEKAIIIIVIISFLATLSFAWTFLIFLISSIILLSTENFYKNRIFREKAKKVITILWFLTIGLCVIDSLLTYYSVHYMKFAIEFNPFVNFIWKTFGLYFGEVIRLLLASLVFWILRKKLYSKEVKQSLIASIVILFIFMIWFAVVISNLYQIYLNSCG